MSILCSRVPPPRSLARPPAKLAVVAVVRQRVFAEALRRGAWVTSQLPKWSALPGGRWGTSAPETAARCVATGYGCCPDDWRPRRALRRRGERRFRLARWSGPPILLDSRYRICDQIVVELREHYVLVGKLVCSG
jgi:hypothetical protein